MIAKIETYYRAVVDCWRLFKKYRAPQQSEAFWQELHDEAHKVYNGNQKSVFAKRLIFVVLDEIDRIWEEMNIG